MAANSSAGIGLHKTTLTIAVRDSAGELIDVRPFPPSVNKIDRFFSHLLPPVRCYKLTNMLKIDSKLFVLLLALNVNPKYS